MDRKIIILLLLFVVFNGKAQKRECFNLFTDRDLYISGETLLIKLFTPGAEESGIVKIDLVNHEGKKIIGITKKIVDQQADGFIYLPDSLRSGCYLLRTSTEKNGMTTFKELYISNRFTGLPESNSDWRPSEVLPLTELPSQTIQIENIEKQYKTREKIQAKVLCSNEMLNQIDGNLLVSVAEVTTSYSTKTFSLKAEPKVSQLIANKGIILEGIVTDKKTTQPCKNAVVYLSIPDSIAGFQYYITREDGRFNFQLENYYGKIPLVIQCFSPDKAQLLKINLSDPDSLHKRTMPAFALHTLPLELRNSVESSMDAVNFRKIFNQKELTIQPAPMVKRDTYPFYGVPTKIIDPQLFIDLPNFSEISRELLPGVKFRTYNRIPTLQVFNFTRQNYFEAPPLLLIDGIPILDLNLIKDMGTKDIDRIEICQSERFYGDLIFPGVVAIYTAKSDYTRIAESDDLIKLNLDVIQPQATLNTPTTQSLNDPDFRQVLLWKPAQEPHQTMAIDFQTSDIQGIFNLIIRGKTKDGMIFYKEQTFEVN